MRSLEEIADALALAGVPTSHPDGPARWPFASRAAPRAKRAAGKVRRIDWLNRPRNLGGGFAMILRVKGWARFQHYRHRRPPWIRLYRSLLDDPTWHDLPLAQ